MSETAVALEMAPAPDVEAAAKMSPGQVDVELGKFGADAAAYSKLFSGDGQATKLFHALIERREQLATAESLIAAAADPNQPLPPGGEMLKNGVSKRDEITGVQDQLALGGSIEEVVEFEIGEPYVGPGDFAILERQVEGRLLKSPEFVKRYLAGDPEARLTMDRWHRIAVTSRPLPPLPRYGLAR